MFFLYIYIINQKLEKIKHKIKNFCMWRKITLGTHSARDMQREVRTARVFAWAFWAGCGRGMFLAATLLLAPNRQETEVLVCLLLAHRLRDY